MSKISEAFTRGKAFIPFITCGDPNLETTATVVPPLLKRVAPTMSRDKIIVVTLSGRGDKDCANVARYRGETIDE